MGIKSLMVDARGQDEIKTFDFGLKLPNPHTILPHGDVWITTDDGVLISVERKTVSDFMSSIADGRLFDQAGRMRAATPWAYEIVIGFVAPDLTGMAVVNGRPTGWHYAAYVGARMTLQEMGVIVVDVENDREFCALVRSIADRKRGPVRVKPQRDPTIIGDDEIIMTALPGIGAERARKLLGHCGEPYHAIEYLTDPVRDDPECKMGTSLKFRARVAYGLPDRFMLGIVEMDDERVAAARALNKRYNYGEHEEASPIERDTEATRDGWPQIER